jgi:hypothetical protein
MDNLNPDKTLSCGCPSTLSSKSCPASVHLTDIELVQRPVRFLPRRVLEVRGEFQQFVTELGVRRMLPDLLAEFIEELDPGVTAFRRARLELLLEKRNKMILVHLRKESRSAQIPGGILKFMRHRRRATRSYLRCLSFTLRVRAADAGRLRAGNALVMLAGDTELRRSSQLEALREEAALDPASDSSQGNHSQWENRGQPPTNTIQ